MGLHEDFRTRVETFLSETDVSAYRLGVDAVKDPNFVTDLREGRSPSARLMDRVDAWMAAYRAEAAKQPAVAQF